jgi:hypothetical protein
MPSTAQEGIMAHLKSLSFTTLPALEANPVLDRRNRTITRLEEQKQLLANPAYVRTVKVWAEKDGSRQQIERQQRILPWWRSASNGSTVFFIKVGQKPVEFEKGKSAISVASPDKVGALIDTLIAAIRSGELDEPLAQASKAVTVKKPKKPA